VRARSRPSLTFGTHSTTGEAGPAAAAPGMRCILLGAMQFLPIGKLRAETLQAIFDKHPLRDPRVVVGPRVGEDAAVIDAGTSYLVATTDAICFATVEIGVFVFQAEDGIRDLTVTGVQTCALPISFLGAQLNTTASFDGASASIHVPKRRLEAGLDLLADVVLRPGFADSEIARQRELRAAQLVQQRDEPVAVANIAFPAIVYGREHPYGHPLNGTDSATARLARERVTEFYRTYYRPNGARLLVVGDVTLAEVRRLAAARLGGWERGEVPAFPSPPAPPAAARTLYLIDKPGAAQSVVRIGHVGPARSTPDWFALEVLNTIVGGAFTSRLNQNLRETHGYTYGAFSQFAPRRLTGAFVALASVVTAKTDSSLIEFLKELRRIRDETVAPPELAKAKAYLTLGLPGDFETTGGAAGRFRELLAFGLPLDYYDHYVDHINAITAADVQRVARQYIDPNHFDIVVVGDKSQIEAGIKALNEGPIVYRDLWGQEVR